MILSKVFDDMIEPKQLLTALQKRVALLEEDLRARCHAQGEVDAPLKAEYEAARGKGRTGLTYNAWRDEELTQVAVAWILAGVFVRFLEDNELIDVPFLAGGDPVRQQRAQDEQSLFFRQHPTASERDYFEHVFNTVGKLPGMKDFFDRRHNPLWRVGPTADAAKALLEFWRKTDPDSGRIVHDFRYQVAGVVPSGDRASEPAEAGTPNQGDDPTRFLGDLYQDLSEVARKRYALLQTPVFVEQFILDRTLTPAIQTFGYKAVRMIDPTCGSGHFLLGGFHRLFQLWQTHEPGENPTVLAQRALNQVYGVDLNPNVVAIARFRLLMAALRACGSGPGGPSIQLKNAPDFRLNLAAGDSLLHGSRFREFEGQQAVQQTFGGDELFRDELKHFYETEDREELHRILGQQYHVVVGNPPYITVKDKALNEAYRKRFDSCHRKYSLAAPFMERFFDLAVKGEDIGERVSRALWRVEGAPGGTPGLPGYVGMITSNSFMKREFGKKLIEEFIPKWDLTHVIDTAGAYIPGHGTPTVILFAKNQQPVARAIRTVMGIKGEPATPDNPERGLVWNAILAQVDQPGSQSDYVSAADTARESFHKHPWSIGGGGAAELKEMLDESVEKTLEQVTEDAGFMAIISEDDAFIGPMAHFRRKKLPQRLFITGDCVRDWTVASGEAVAFPYDDSREQISVISLPSSGALLQSFWPNRVPLSARKMFGKTPVEHGLAWYQFIYLTPKRFLSSQFLAFASVATHNQFSLMRRGDVLNRHAPVVVLDANASDAEHIALLGLLNSSTACFWMKQVFYPKGGDYQGDEGARVRTTLWDERYEFDSTKLKQFPVPTDKPLSLARELGRFAQELKTHTPVAVLEKSAISNLNTQMATSRAKFIHLRGRMIALQEELDWECYRLYGLLPDSSLSFPLCASASLRLGVESGDLELTQSREDAEAQRSEEISLPPLKLGERAFEIVMARKMAAGELQTTWFERHGSTPITELPLHWPQPYRELVERRIALMEADRNIGLIEQPEYKRRWNVEPWDEQLERALREWLLNRLEQYFFGGERMKAGDPEGQTESWQDRIMGTKQDVGNPVPMILSGDDSVGTFRSSFPGGIQPALCSTSQLAAVVETDQDFLRVAEIYSGGPGFSVGKLVRELVEAESVPFLPFQRYKESGLRKRQDWEQVWDWQRKEDAIDKQEKVDEPGIPEAEREARKQRANARKKQEIGDIPVPPKYSSSDFKKSNWWKLRGKLDVPKERWISYPGAERNGDPSPVIAWAGWDHAQQAQALAAYYIDASQNQGWGPEKLKPLLAGLADRLPWLKQWHNVFNPDFSSGLGDYFAGFLDEEARKQGTTVEGVDRMRLGVGEGG